MEYALNLLFCYNISLVWSEWEERSFSNSDIQKKIALILWIKQGEGKIQEEEEVKDDEIFSYNLSWRKQIVPLTLYHFGLSTLLSLEN